MQFQKQEKFERVGVRKFSGISSSVVYHLHDVQSMNT